MGGLAMGSSRGWRAGAWVAALALVAVIFAPAVGFGFVSWDDPIHLTENPLVLQPGEHGWRELLLTPQLGYPSPVTVLSYWLEHGLFGLHSAAPYHATNLALHLACCALVFAIGRRLGLGWLGGLAAMLCFGLHPVVAEPVCWITGRKDLLAAAFGLLATCDGLRHPFELRRRRSYVAPALFAVAAFAKPVVLFLVVLLPLWHLLRRKPVGRSLAAAAPLAAVAGIVFPLAMRGQLVTASVREDLGLLGVLREAWYALGFNLGLLSLARETSAVYLPSPWPPPFTPAVDLAPLAGLAIGAAALIWLRSERRRIGVAGAAFALLAYLPSSNLIPLTRYLADVYGYLPLAGVGWLVGALFEQFGARLSTAARRWSVPALIALGAVVLSIGSARAATKWQNSVTLWGNAYRQYPHDYRLCRNLANGYNELGKPAAALAAYRACARRFGLEPFQKNIAVTLYRLGQRDRAREQFRQLSQTRPTDPVVRKYCRRLGLPLPPLEER